MKDALFIAFQKMIPQHLLSRAAGWIAENKTPWFKNFLIEQFIKKYHVDMSLAIDENPHSYKNFNDFFTRALKQNARPIDKNLLSITSPADGVISQIGEITEDKILQAKDHWFTVTELLGGDKKLAEKFYGGRFTTIYLSPKDYHRVHMPITGQLSQMIYIPGDLYSVNGTTTKEIPNLFARNERVAAVFDTKYGPAAVVMVGAMIVGSIETVWDGQITPQSKNVKTFLYKKTRSVTLQKGAEMGRFKLGSTAILLFPKESIEWEGGLETQSNVSVGEAIGNITCA